jgi:hypothetical protein
MTKKTLNSQFALFFQSNYTDSFENFSLKIKSKLGESNVTQIVPIPLDVPILIPRLTLQYANYNINVSKERIDVFFRDDQGIKDIIEKLSDVLLIELGLKIGRVGFVKNLFVESSVSELKNLLPADKIRNLPITEIAIRINLKKTILLHDCNSIQNLTIGFVQKPDGSKEEGTIVTRDINTSEKNLLSVQFLKTDIVTFFSEFNTETEHILLLD